PPRVLAVEAIVKTVAGIVRHPLQVESAFLARRSHIRIADKNLMRFLRPRDLAAVSEGDAMSRPLCPTSHASAHEFIAHPHVAISPDLVLPSHQGRGAGGRRPDQSVRLD